MFRHSRVLRQHNLFSRHDVHTDPSGSRRLAFVRPIQISSNYQKVLFLTRDHDSLLRFTSRGQGFPRCLSPLFRSHCRKPWQVPHGTVRHLGMQPLRSTLVRLLKQSPIAPDYQRTNNRQYHCLYVRRPTTRSPRTGTAAQRW